MCSSGASISGDLKITWLKDGRELTSNPNQKIHQILTMSILSVTSLSAANSGKYTCTASSTAGTTSVSKEMMVYGQYVFLKVCYCRQSWETFVYSQFALDGHVRFTCEIQSRFSI